MTKRRPRKNPMSVMPNSRARFTARSEGADTDASTGIPPPTPSERSQSRHGHSPSAMNRRSGKRSSQAPSRLPCLPRCASPRPRAGPAIRLSRLNRPAACSRTCPAKDGLRRTQLIRQAAKDFGIDGAVRVGRNDVAHPHGVNGSLAADSAAGSSIEVAWLDSRSKTTPGARSTRTRLAPFCGHHLA